MTEGASRARRLLVPTAVAVLVIGIARVALDVPFGVLVQGAIIGGLSALLALGLAIVWRANRVINFAAGDLGAVPATLAVLLTVSTVGFGWWAGLGVGLVTALALGALVELVIVRRFARSPRLVLTVATIGLAQLLAAGALLLPRAFTLPGNPVPQPFDVSITIDPITFGATDIVAVIVIPLVFIGLALFFSRADVGIAVRAAAERADRAATLGIPVHRLHRVVWVLATVLAFLAVYLRAGIIGLPIGEVLGPAILLRALAAAVIGGMERLPVIAGAAILLGVVEQAVIWHWHEPGYVDPVLFVVVVVALLVTRVRTDRSADVSTWQAAREVRPVPSAAGAAPGGADRAMDDRRGRRRGAGGGAGIPVPEPHQPGRHDPRVRDHRAVARRAHGLGRPGQPGSGGVRRCRRSRCRSRDVTPRVRSGAGRHPGWSGRRGDRAAHRAPGTAPAGAHARRDEPRVRARDIVVAPEPELLR